MSMLASSLPLAEFATQEAPRVAQYVLNYSTIQKEKEQAKSEADKLMEADQKNTEQMVLKKYTELVLEINKLKASQTDNAKLEELQEDLAALIKKYNTILKLPNPSSP